ncbi:response regulator transcription factor [Sphingomonas sp. TX0543]|nr:response regulator [Sphingomonas sp. 3P27F8]
MSDSQLVAIVDDDPGVSGSIASLLRSAGLESERFSYGGDLIDRGVLDEFCCIISDLHMEGMDGKALQLELIRLGWSGPFIVITAFPNDSEREQMMSKGAHAFVSKPIDPDGFLDLVEAAVA